MRRLAGLIYVVCFVVALGFLSGGCSNGGRSGPVLAVHDGAGGKKSLDYGLAITLDASGRILVAGGSDHWMSQGSDMVIWRYNPDGTLDKTFDDPTDGQGPGWVVHDGGTGVVPDAVGRAIALDASGRILVTGSSSSGGSGYDMVIWRYNPDGMLDTTFDDPTDGRGPGLVVYDGGAGGGAYDRGRAIALEASGRILVAGSGQNSAGDGGMVIWRYTSSGTLDPTFATGGVAVHDGAGVWASGLAIALDTSGRILVAGGTGNIPGDYDMAIWRYNPDGTLDTTFDDPTDGQGPGWVVHDGAAGGGRLDYGRAIALDAAGRILVAGDSQNAMQGEDMVIWRYNPDGTLDTTFDDPTDGQGPGWVVHDGAAGGGGDDFGRGIALDASGRILVAGWSSNGTDLDMAIWRYTSSGTLDPSFRNGGVAVHHSAAGGGSRDLGEAIALDASGRILVAGKSVNGKPRPRCWPGPLPYDMVIWRYQ